MIFGGAYRTLRWEGTVVVGGTYWWVMRAETKKLVRSVEVSLSKSR